MFTKTITLATFATGAMARSLQQDDRGILLAVQKPTITANATATKVTPWVTVAWKTGPSATTETYTVSCFPLDVGADPLTCDTYGTPDPTLTASGELGKALLPSTVEEVFDLPGAQEGDDIQCFIDVEGQFGYASKCIELGATFKGDEPTTRSIETDPERLFAVVQKPTVVADLADQDITVSWKTGPAAVGGSYAVSCFQVLEGADPITCNNLSDNLPIGSATGDYAKTLMKDTYTETIDFGEAVSGDIVQCFIEAEGEYGKLSKCKEAGEDEFVDPTPAPAPNGPLRSIETDADRLFAVVQKPTVVADFADEDITVSWKTGPAAVGGNYTVSCFEVLLGRDITCKNLADYEPVGSATGDYTKTLMKDTYTETIEYAGEDGEIVQCFIEAEGEYGKLSKCKEAGEDEFVDPTPAPAPNGPLRSIETDADRLFAVVQKPTVVADFADEDITVSWKTGPAAVGGNYTVSCFEVLLGRDITCKNLADYEPVGSATGDYTKTLMKDTYTETIEYAGEDGEIVQCFIEAEGEYGKLSKCKEAGEDEFVDPTPAPEPAPAPPAP